MFLKNRILILLVNSSPLTLQVIVALVVTAVIYFKTLVTHLSSKSLYLTEYMYITRFVHSSPTRHSKNDDE